MRVIVWMIFLLGSVWTLAQNDRFALVLTVQDAIGPATSDYIHEGLELAREKNATLVILQLDTPGGLDSAMRDIIRDILASPIPVALYVSPSGARAASAGTYMLYASHVAAMAPATNLGAATPVQIGGLPKIMPPGTEKEEEKDDKTNTGTDSEEKQAKDESIDLSGDAMTRKMVNDAAAYIRSLAEMRGRNADWAENAVRQASSLSAESALEQGVIDLIASDIQDLLEQIDGRITEVNSQELTLDTQGLVIERFEQDWRNRFLSVITNPNIAYILMLLGIYGLFFELYNPGFVLPGIIGGICLLLALYSMQVLPVNYAGLGLILLGIAFMVAELFVPSFGALGIGGVVAFIIGSIILFDVEGGNIAISLPLIAGVSTVTAAFFLIVIRMAFQSHHRPVVSGSEEILGGIGEVLEDFEKNGHIHIHGENWQVESSVPLKKGNSVRVIDRTGLVLKVEPLTTEEK